MQKNYFLFTLLFFTGCMGIAVREKVIGNYYLVAPDTEEELSLGYREPSDPNKGFEGVVEPTVFSVGYDNEFIIIKQHPMDFPNPPNKKVTNYFIIPLKANVHEKGNYFGVIGPLTFEQFNQEKEKLNISPDLKFTIVEKDLE